MIGDDLSPFFVVGEFCAPGDTLGGADVVGTFDAQYVAAGGGFGMSDSRPAYTMPTAAVPANVVGMVLVHKGASYRVEDPQPDGTGVSILILEEA